MDEETVIERGIALLELLEHDELSLAAVLDRIELVTSDPRLQRAIIDRAKEEGIIKQEDDRVTPQSPSFLRFQADVRSKEGEFTCRRCGSKLSTGYFMMLEESEFGPFGSSCIRKVTGRE